MAIWKNKTNLPIFSSGDFYSYFQDLLTPTRYPAIDKMKVSIFRNANYYFTTSVYEELAYEANNTPETIKNAIQFLGEVAANERSKEIAAIERYLKDIENKIPETFRNGRTYKEIIENLKTMSNNLSSQVFDANKIKNFYEELITYINMIRRSIEEFKIRLEQIKETNNEQWTDLAKRSLLFRAETDLVSLLKNTIGVAERQKNGSFSSQIRERIFDYLNGGKGGENIKNNLTLQNNLFGIMSIMTIDLEKYLNKRKDAHQGFEEIDNLQDVITDYFNQQDSFFLKEVKNIMNGGNISEEIATAIKSIEDVLGIDYQGLAPTGKNLQKRIDTMNKQVLQNARGPVSGERNYIAKSLKKMGLTNVLNNLQRTTWHVSVKDGKGSKKPIAGILYEAIAAILEGGGSRRIGGAGAVDEIFCSFLIGIEDPLEREKISRILTNLANAMKISYLDARQDRFDDISQLSKNVNTDIDKIIKELETQAKALGVPDNDLFVYHESLKLYGTIEETRDGSRRATKFHGREMQALNMLDDLYSIADLDDTVKLLDKEALKGVILNLSDLAAAPHMKSPVENYFSIFAGLLMFTDIRNMALELGKEATKQVSYSSTKNVHLYLLNDTYYPASLILTQVYQVLLSGINSISLKDGIKATVNVNGANKAIGTYVSMLQKARAEGEPSPYESDDWENMAETVAAGTKITISFLSSFLNFTDNIAKKLQ